MRVLATLVDTLILLVVTFPLIWMVYGAEYFSSTSTNFVEGPAEVFISYVLPAIYSIMFWQFRQATPGKLLLSLRILDAKTGEPVVGGRLVVRYLGYYVSALALLLGFIWVGFDKRKQGWHDKMAGTVVVIVKEEIANT